MDRHGHVVTFYSYKGGVGRSMALANIAALYAQRGKRVLALDFDFEAPGLHRYFLSPREAGGPTRHEPREPRLGVLNFFQLVHETLKKEYPKGSQLQSTEVPERLQRLLGELLDRGDYLYTVRVHDPNRKQIAPSPVQFIAAARFDESYPSLVRSFDWQRFYEDYAEVFPALARELSRRYDYVLIDSRTGVTDIGSICTMLLPDKLVLVFSPNEQSLRGSLDAGWQAVEGRKAMTDRPSLQVFPLLSRVEDGEEQLKKQWIMRASQGFERLFREAYTTTSPDLETYFNAVRVPHRSYYAYGERIAVEIQPSSETGSLAQAYNQLVGCLDHPSLIDAQESIHRSGFSIEDETVRSLMGQLQGGLLREIANHTTLRPVLGVLDAHSTLGRGNAQEALRLIDTVIEDPGLAEAPDPIGLLTIALQTKGRALSQLGRHADAIATHDRIVALFSDESDDDSHIPVAKAQLSTGAQLLELQQHNEALNALEDALQRFEKSDTKEGQKGQADVLIMKAKAHREMGRNDEAMATLDQLIQTFGSSTNPDIIARTATAFLHKIKIYAKLNQHDEAIALSDHVFERFGDAKDARLIDTVTRALSTKTISLGEQRRFEEVPASANNLLHLAEQAATSEVLEQTASGLFLKGAAYQILGRLDEAVTTFESLINRLGHIERPSVLTHVARAMYAKSVSLRDAGRRDEALSAAMETVRRFGQAEDPKLRLIAANAFAFRVRLLTASENLEASEDEDKEALLAAYDEFTDRFGDLPDATVRTNAVKMLLLKSKHLEKLGRYADAAASYMRACARIGDSPPPELHALLPHANNSAGFALLCHAKQVWQRGDPTKARSLLGEASALFALARAQAPETPSILGNAGYTAFLLGQESEARALLAKAVELGGAQIVAAELADADISSLPQDDAFRELVRSLSKRDATA